MFPNGVLEQLWQLGVAGIFIVYLWLQVRELKTDYSELLDEQKTEREKWDKKLKVQLTAQQTKFNEQLAKRDAEISALRTELASELRLRLQDKTRYEEQLWHTTEQVRAVLEVIKK